MEFSVFVFRMAVESAPAEQGQQLQLISSWAVDGLKRKHLFQDTDELIFHLE